VDGQPVKALPRPIARWADELAALSHEARDLLGPWLPILERVRGAISVLHSHAEGEPDGLSGLNRRGLYERLVATEWALLEAVPDEFVRRAGAGEHLFHQLARTEPAGAGRVVVLFDAGPWQLGAPRLAHLAWLLVLARHARSRSVHLAWGVLQSPAEGLRESTDAGDIRALMAARTHETVGAAMVAAWADRLGPAAKREERWLVTHARDARTAARLEAATLAVAEPDDPLAAAPLAGALVVDATSSTSLKHGVVLPLPPRRACARLLRDPFRDEPRGALVRMPHPDTTIAAGAQVVFSATSRHVLARLESGAIVALAVSTDEERAIQQIATLVPAEGTEVVAAGWRKGKMYVLTTDDAKLTLHTGRGSRWFPSTSFTDVSGFTLPMPVTSPAVLGRLFVDRHGAKLYFCDERWRLLVANLPEHTVSPLAAPVLAWNHLPSPGEIACVLRVPEGHLELQILFADERVRLMEGRHRVSRGFVVVPNKGTEPSMVGLGTGDGEWHVCSPPWKTVTTVALAAETPVYGAAVVDGRPCLLVRSSAPERLEFVAGDRRVASVTFPDEVEHACLHPNGHWIAAQVAGGLCVYDRRGKLRLHWGGPWR
jgi:hypothetical protein